MIYQVGVTGDGRRVLAGLFRFHETSGLPLDALFAELNDRRCIPSWEHFLDEAVAAGMKRERVIARLSEPLMDVYGPARARDILARMAK